jgi:hypothetical protein
VKRYSTRFLLTTAAIGAAGGLLVGLYSTVAYRSYGVESFAPAAQVAFFALMLASGIGFTLIALVLAARLRRAGVARTISTTA